MAHLLTLAIPLAGAGFLACAEHPSDPARMRASKATALGQSVSSLDVGLASPGWQAQARLLVAGHSTAPVSAYRIYALVSVAQYAAVVAIARDEANHTPGSAGSLDQSTPGPGGRSSREAEHGAVAGASTQVLSFFYPDAAAALEQRLANEGSAGPGEIHPAFTRGVAAGRAMGEVMLAWSRNDHFADAWNGTIPVGSGLWTSVGAPASPLLGFVKPYFLISGAQFHPPAPPAFGSPEFVAALDEVSSLSLTRTPEQLASAQYWAMSTGTQTALGHWNELAATYIEESRLDERAATRVFAVMDAAVMDATIACWEAKYTYYLIRPWQVNTAITTPIGRPNHPSFPSGHSCLAGAAAGVLGHFFPNHVEAVNDMVTANGLSRMYGGLHYRFDIEAGKTLGRAVAAWAIAVDESRGVLAATTSPSRSLPIRGPTPRG